MKEMMFEGSAPQQVSLKSTLISVVPFQISEYKPGLIPGQFDIPACTGSKPVVKVIGESIYYVYIDHDRGSLKVIDPSYKLAQSIVNDYNQAQLAARPGCHPGFFWKLGEFTADQVERLFPDELEAIKVIQMDWFLELIKLADDDWEKTRQHNSISDIQRFALKAVDPGNSKMRPWVLVNPMHEHKELTTMLCKACGSDVPIDVAVCKYCRCILDHKKYAQLQFTPADQIDLEKITRQ